MILILKLIYSFINTLDSFTNYNLKNIWVAMKLTVKTLKGEVMDVEI
jgi:hypothetical protein